MIAEVGRGGGEAVGAGVLAPLAGRAAEAPSRAYSFGASASVPSSRSRPFGQGSELEGQEAGRHILEWSR